MNFGKKFRFGNNDERPHYTLVHPEPTQQNLQIEAERLEKEIVDLIAKAAARELVSESDEEEAGARSSSLSAELFG